MLRDQNLVESQKVGVEVHYKIKNDEVWEILELAKDLIVEQINQTQSALEDR